MLFNVLIPRLWTCAFHACYLAFADSEFITGNPKNLCICCRNKLHLIALFLAVIVLLERD